MFRPPGHGQGRGRALELTLRRHRNNVATAVVGTLPSRPQALLLRVGDMLEVVNGAAPRRSAVCDEDGSTAEAAFIGCSLEAAFSTVCEVERIFFDDGRISGTIREVMPMALP